MHSTVREAQAEHLAGVERTAATEGDDRVDRCVLELVDRLVEPVDRPDSPRPGRGLERAARRSAPQPVRRGHARPLPASRRAARDRRRRGRPPGRHRARRRRASGCAVSRCAPSSAELRHEGVLVLDRSGGRPARVGARPARDLDLEHRRAVGGAKTSDRLAQPCDALDGLGRGVAAGQRRLRSDRALRAAVGWPPTESCAPLLITTCFRLRGPRVPITARLPMCMSTAPSPSRQTTWRAGSPERDAERDLRAVAHRADREEVPPVAVGPIARGRRRPRARSCRSSRRPRPSVEPTEHERRPPPLAWARRVVASPRPARARRTSPRERAARARSPSASIRARIRASSPTGSPVSASSTSYSSPSVESSASMRPFPGRHAAARRGRPARRASRSGTGRGSGRPPGRGARAAG